MLHGVLHLQGMDHETDNGAMKRAEQRWRQKLGLPTSLVERTVAQALVPAAPALMPAPGALKK